MKKTQRQIVIGDVHGHYAGLIALTHLLNLAEDDQLYFLGDLIDRGPQSAQVIEYVRSHGYPCLRGNHEEMLMEAFPNNQVHQGNFKAWLYSGGSTTLDSYEGDTARLLADVQWLRTLPLYLDLGDIWLVHAGVNPQRSLEEQSSHEFCWIRDEFHFYPQPFFADKTIITGHTITFTLPGLKAGKIAQGKGWLNIETGAYHPRSGWLTALDWTNQSVYQVNVFDKSTRQLSLEDAAVPLSVTYAGSAS
jgi:serine/threonine protein phosphatase 1